MFNFGLGVCVLASLLSATSAPRDEISLNGVWQFQKVEKLEAPPATGKWSDRDVPNSLLRGTEYERAWFRRTFNVPKSMQGKRIKIRFDGVKYDSRVYVNGKHVGGCFNGHDPFEVDITDVVRLDEPNKLAVGCHDWTTTFAPGKRVDFSKKPSWERPRCFVKDRVIAPIGGLYHFYGIWGDVALIAHPAIYVKDLFIKTSVRRGEMVVDYTVTNESSKDVEVELRTTVEDKHTDGLKLPNTRLKVPAGKTVTTTIRRPWKDPHLWSHVDPYLYHLRSELSSGDVLRTRFGFREFWTKGHHCYLNGVKINLLAASWWPNGEKAISREEVTRRWTTLKACGCVVFRTHTQPWRRIHYDVADEIGLLMIVEGAMWHDPKLIRCEDPRYWDNFAIHLESMVDRDKNRPSVIMWSVENEAYGDSRKREEATCAGLARVGRLVKQWDPTRPVYFESDADPEGVGNVIGCHYPHELPRYRLWPNEAEWLKKGTTVLRGHGKREFVWNQQKPLYIGEFLWVPAGTPAPQTVFFGDDAYLNLQDYNNVHMKAEAWKMQIIGYRHAEVAGISPWCLSRNATIDHPLHQACKYAYQHIATYCHDYDSRFYAGRKIPRRVEVFNDIMKPSDLELTWTLSNGNRVVERGSRKLHLEPAGHQMLEGITLNMPKVDKRTPLQWRLTLKRNGKQVFDDTHEYSVYPTPKLPTIDARIGLFDPIGTTKKLFQTNQLSTKPVTSLDKLPDDIDVLVIGTGALQSKTSGSSGSRRNAIAKFVGRGGRILVLRQEKYPADIFELKQNPPGSTMTFALRPSHPAVKGVRPDDLKFWRGDHLVTSNELSRPVTGSSIPIVVSCNGAGLQYSPLLERPTGQGSVIHAQMRLIDKFNTEPAAAQILGNVIKYLANYRPISRKTGVVCDSSKYHDFLKKLGLRFDNLTNKLGQTDLSNYSLIICRGRVEAPDKLSQFVKQGGKVLIHRADSKALSQLKPVQISLRPYSGAVSRAEGSHPLIEAIAREDLCWYGEHKGRSWQPHKRLGEVADGALCFTKTANTEAAKTYEIEKWKRDNVGLAQFRGPGVTFLTNATTSTEIEFKSTSNYVLSLVARGTRCDGQYPIAQITIDDVPFGSIQVTSDKWQTYSCFGWIKAGRHNVSVGFINDKQNKKGDRNLFVDKVLVARDTTPVQITNLTVPNAITAINYGKGLFVIDQLRWDDTEKRNYRKATRYVTSLLTALNGNLTTLKQAKPSNTNK